MKIKATAIALTIATSAIVTEPAHAQTTEQKTDALLVALGREICAEIKEEVKTIFSLKESMTLEEAKAFTRETALENDSPSEDMLQWLYDKTVDITYEESDLFKARKETYDNCERVFKWKYGILINE